MSRNADRIRKALEQHGITPEDIHWEPLGLDIEMQGREGGWFIDGESYGHSVDAVLEFIHQFPDSLRERYED